MKLLRAIDRLIRDLWFGPGNEHADLARILATFAVLAEVGGECWNIHLKQPVDLAALGGGIAAILTASAGYLAAKAWQATQHQVALSIKKDTKDA